MKSSIIKALILFIIVLSLLPNCTQMQISPLEELKMIGIKMKQKVHVEYSYQCKIFRSYSTDTNSWQGKMYFELNPQDSLLVLISIINLKPL